MVAGFSSEGKNEKNDNRSKSVRRERKSAKELGARLVKGSGSSRFSKGDFRSDNDRCGIRSGYSYQQKCGDKGVRLTPEILDQTRKEAVMHNKVPVVEVIVGGHEPWYLIDQETWMRLSGEGGKS